MKPEVKTESEFKKFMMFFLFCQHQNACQTSPGRQQPQGHI